MHTQIRPWFAPQPRVTEREVRSAAAGRTIPSEQHLRFAASKHRPWQFKTEQP